MVVEPASGRQPSPRRRLEAGRDGPRTGGWRYWRVTLDAVYREMATEDRGVREW
jgi:hypothetical protein